MSDTGPCNCDQALALQKENESLRKHIHNITRDTRILTCVYCGEEYPPGTPTHGSKVLTEHIKKCPKHPMSELLEVAELFLSDACSCASLSDQGAICKHCRLREVFKKLD